jgi:hypothetical protein
MGRLLSALVLLASTTSAFGQWLDLPTPGIPRMRDGKPDLAAPAPRTAEGRPELSGLWRPAGVSGDLRDARDLKPWVREAMAAHEKNYYKQGPHMQCLPSGPGYIAGAGGGGGGYKRIVQGSSTLAILNSDLTYRQVFLDGRKLEADPLPIWMGYSVGRWEGQTLVVESNGYNAKTWLHPEGLVHSEQLRVTERYSRPAFGRLLIDVTYADPGAFDKPLHAVVEMRYAADDEMLELVCNEAAENSSQHWTGNKLTDAAQAAVDVPVAILGGYVGRYEGIWLSNPTQVEITLEDGRLFVARNGSVRSALVAQSETTFVCPTCQWGQPYVFTRGADGVATQVSEVQVSGAWIFKRTR